MLRPLPWAGETQLHYLSAAHCAALVTFGSELLLLADISTIYPLPHHGHLTSHEHHSSLTQGEREYPNRLKHNKYDLHHFGEGWGGLWVVVFTLKKAQTFPIPFGEAGEVWATDKSQADYSAIVILRLHTSRRAGRGWVWCYRHYRCQTPPCFHRYLRAGCAWHPHVCTLTGVLHNYVSLSYSLFTYLLITLTASAVSIFPSPSTSAVALLSLSVVPLI